MSLYEDCFHQLSFYLEKLSFQFLQDRHKRGLFEALEKVKAGEIQFLFTRNHVYTQNDKK